MGWKSRCQPNGQTVSRRRTKCRGDGGPRVAGPWCYGRRAPGSTPGSARWIRMSTNSACKCPAHVTGREAAVVTSRVVLMSRTRAARVQPGAN